MLAAEDYSGNPAAGSGQRRRATSSARTSSPTTPTRSTPPASATTSTTSTAWRTAPDPLGVLGHYDAVVWYTGDDYLTRRPDLTARTGTSASRSTRCSASAPSSTRAASCSTPASGPAYGALERRPRRTPPGSRSTATRPRTPTRRVGPEREPDERRAVLNDDFLQYYLGAYLHIERRQHGEDDGGRRGLRTTWRGVRDAPFTGSRGPTARTIRTHLHSRSRPRCSSRTHFPLFDSAIWRLAATGRRPFDPPTRPYYMFATPTTRPTSGCARRSTSRDATSGDLTFKFSSDPEPDCDFMVVEAHTRRRNDDWTTLPDTSGDTRTEEVRRVLDISSDALHPFLHYQPTSSASPPDGRRLHEHRHDRHVERLHRQLRAAARTGPSTSRRSPASRSSCSSPTYQTGAAGPGHLDDVAKVTVDGAVVDSTDFEADNGGWRAGAAARRDRLRRRQLDAAPPSSSPRAASSGPTDTVYNGFGLEGMDGPGEAARPGVGHEAHALQYLGVIEDNPGQATPCPAPGGNPTPGGDPPAAPTRRRRSSRASACG